MEEGEFLIRLCNKKFPFCVRMQNRYVLCESLQRPISRKRQESSLELANCQS
jgi:hypothetical protein